MSSRYHHVQYGYEVCIHTCGCSNFDSLRLWRREGGTCARHAKSRKVHPHCNPRCQGHLAFRSGAPRDSRARPPTRQEILDHLTPEQASLELERLGIELQEENETIATSEPCVALALYRYYSNGYLLLLQNGY